MKGLYIHSELYYTLYIKHPAINQMQVYSIYIIILPNWETAGRVLYLNALQLPGCGMKNIYKFYSKKKLPKT